MLLGGSAACAGIEPRRFASATLIAALVTAIALPALHAQSPASSRTTVIMLGTGNPTLDPDRMGPATVIVVDSTAYLIDAGTYRSQFHTSMEELLDVARAARPKLLVLYHQTRGNNEAGQRFIQAGFDGRVVVAKDLDVFH